MTAPASRNRVTTDDSRETFAPTNAYEPARRGQLKRNRDEENMLPVLFIWSLVAILSYRTVSNCQAHRVARDACLDQDRNTVQWPMKHESVMLIIRLARCTYPRTRPMYRSASKARAMSKASGLISPTALKDGLISVIRSMYACDNHVSAVVLGFPAKRNLHGRG